MVTKIGHLEVNKISSRPDDHLFIWVKEEGAPFGAQPIKEGGLVKQDMDFHPFPWIASPVKTSSVADPYIQPT